VKHWDKFPAEFLQYSSLQVLNNSQYSYLPGMIKDCGTVEWHLEVPTKCTLLQSLKETEDLLSTLTGPFAVSHIPSCRSLGALLDQKSIYVDKNFPLSCCWAIWNISYSHHTISI